VPTDLFESARVVVVVAENANDKSEVIEVARGLAAPILVASADDSLSEPLADLSTRAVLHSGPKLDLPAEVAQIEITANWLEDLRAELGPVVRSEEHTSELQSRFDLVCRLLLEKKNIILTISDC